MTVVTVERIAAGGDGVAHLDDGITVFVPRTAPGESVEIRVVARRRRYARALLERVLEPSAARVAPRCPHYDGDRCGGCQLQHLAGDAQREAKGHIVEDALHRIGGRAPRSVPVNPSPDDWRYRARVGLDVADTNIGYHRYDDPMGVFELGDCWIARDTIMGLWAEVSRARVRLPRGVTGVALREDREGHLHVIVEGGAPPWDAVPLQHALEPADVTVWWRPTGGAARAVAGRARGFPALAFEQVHPGFAETIRSAAVTAAGDLHGRVAWDLYGGVGDSAAALARAGAEAWSVDADQGVIEWGRAHLPVEGVQRVAGLVEHEVARLPEPAAVIANPPRVGMAAVVCRRLEAWARERPGARLIYVSCDPATLARDLGRMPAFRIESLVAYDLFPQTAHVEALAVLEAA
jgi:23S rRNA (uracil1939-C5)-methyltransferase